MSSLNDDFSLNYNQIEINRNRGLEYYRKLQKTEKVLTDEIHNATRKFL